MKKINQQLIGKSKVSDIVHILRMIATEWNLNLSKESDFKIAQRILINSVINN